MAEPSPAARASRRVLFALLAFALLLVGGGVVMVAHLAAGGVARVEAATVQGAGGDVAVIFTNRGTRAGFLCGWVNLSCPGSARKTVYVCSDQVAPAGKTTRPTGLQLGGRAGCRVAFVADDEVVL